jgi:hypothetical protein
MIFIYVSELQEEAPMEKEHQKRGNKAYIGNPTLIYTTSCRKVKGEKLSEKEIRNKMKMGGAHEVRERLFKEGISTGGVTLLPMMSKEEKEKYHKRNIRSMKIGGATPKGDTLFH